MVKPAGGASLALQGRRDPQHAAGDVDIPADHQAFGKARIQCHVGAQPPIQALVHTVGLPALIRPVGRNDRQHAQRALADA